MVFFNSPSVWPEATDPSEPSGSWPISRLANFSSTYHPSDLYPPTENSEEPKNKVYIKYIKISFMLTESYPSKNKKMLILLFVVLLGFWFYLAYTNLFYFSLPWMDSWAHMGPAVKTWPFHLRMPVVGNFLGGDHTWAIQWPGSETVASIILFLLPSNPSSQVCYMILLWIILALAMGMLTYNVTHNYYIALISVFLILFDRNYFAIAHGQRPEFVATLVLLWLMATLFKILKGSINECIFLQFYICCFLLTVVHPITLILALISFFLCIIFVLTKNWPSKTLYYTSTSLFIGITILVLSFINSNDAWLQFSDHLNQNIDKLAFPITLYKSINQFYFPLYTGGLVIIFGITYSIFQIFCGVVEKKIAFNQVLSLYILTSSIIVSFHYNTYYAIFVFTLCLISFSSLISDIWPSSPVLRRVVTLALILFTGVHGLFWFTREMKYLKSGKPDLRHELFVFLNGLPSSRRVFIPECLWETSLYSSNPDKYLMNTLPYVVSDSRRKLYENYAYRDLRNNDLLIVDHFSSNKGFFLEKLSSSGWRKINNFSHFLPGKSPWGYNLDTYVMVKNNKSK
jgi:hypothetical protein